MRWTWLGLGLTLAACAVPDGHDPKRGVAVDDVTSADGLKAPKPGKTTFAREMKDRLLSVPIQKKAFDKPVVLYSIKLADVGTTEDLLLRGELTLSTCGLKDISGTASDGEKNPCSIPELKNSPYEYSPHFGVYFAFGTSENDTSGEKLSEVQDTTCNHREHHCTIAIPETRAKSNVAAPVRFLNMIVAADDPAARSFDLMIVEQTHGLLAVTRLGEGARPAPVEQKTADAIPKGRIDIDREEGDGGPLGVDPKVDHAIYRVRLDDLLPGDIIDANAKLIGKIFNGPADCDPLIASELIVSDEPVTSTKKPGDEKLTQKNGVNCIEHDGDVCTYRKSGAVQLGAKAPSTMFVTLVTTAGRTCVPPGFEWSVEKGGGLDVRVRRSASAR